MSDLVVRDFTLTASVLPAVEACPAARVYSGPSGKPGHAAWWGIAVHRFIQYAKTRGEDYALEYIESKFHRTLRCCSMIDLDAIPDGRHEIKVTVDVLRMLAVEGKEERVSPDCSIAGRLDLVHDHDGVYESAVADWKTGKRTDYAPHGDAQLLVGALALWIRRGKPDALTHGALVGVRSNGDMDWYRASWCPEELEQFAKKVRRLVLLTSETRAELREEGVAPEFAPGPHCASCLATLACPSATKEAIAYRRGK